MDTFNKELAINGGEPVTKNPIIIHKPYLDEKDFSAINEAARSTFVSGNGPKCRKFEEKLAKYLGVKYVFFTNSCTAALDLAFKAKEFPPGSEVIVPDFTYTSTALGPLLNNLKVVLCDVDPENGNIDVNKIETLITEKTMAIVPVDYAGNPVDMDAINAIAKKYGLYVVHDTAQSIGAKYKGRKTGTLADVSTFSFHGTKNITTGEGGALVTNDDGVAEKVIYMREKGTNKQSFLVDNKTKGFYEYVTIGNSYVQSNILGALGITQLEKLEWITKERKKIAEFYLKELKDIPELDFLKITAGAEPNWHIFGILVQSEKKYWIMDALHAEGVMANVHYTPLHRNYLYREYGIDDDFPGAMEFFERFLRLPIYPSLEERERIRIIKAVKKVIR